MKGLLRKFLVCALSAAMLVTSLAVTAFAGDGTDETLYEMSSSAVDATVPAGNVKSLKGTKLGSFDYIEGYDIATIRYYTGANTYEFADFVYNASTKTYDYYFSKPSGFSITQGTEFVRGESVKGCTVVAEYYSTTVWDGAIDVSWYDPDKSEFCLYTPAQLAGVAAIVNGSVDIETKDYDIKGERISDSEKVSGYDYTFDMKYISYWFEANASLIATATGDCYHGLAANDFSDKIVYLMNDMDLGGVDGSKLNRNDMVESYEVEDATTHKISTQSDTHNIYDYPNWMPIGGLFPYDLGNGDAIVSSKFNGSIDGCGHHINNIYCFRYSYKTCGDTAFGYSQGVGLIGYLGTLYSKDTLLAGEEKYFEEDTDPDASAKYIEVSPETSPSVRNLSLSGFMYGRRMVGGIVGAIGSGGSATTGAAVAGVKIENVANHAYVYGTDSKGTAGIAGRTLSTCYIINCYNTGYVSNVDYACGQGGIVGENEGATIICCYNTGTINSGTLNRGRGIGGDTSGSNYQVTDCYYLEGTGDCTTESGYWISDDLDKVASICRSSKLTIDVTEMTKAQMTDGTLLALLNVNGKAYTAGEDGYPILVWEAGNEGTGSINLVSPSNGTLTASKTGSVKNGTVVYLTSEPDTGYKCRYFTKDGNKLTGNYVTIDGNNKISAYIEEIKPGSIKLPSNSVVDFTVMKNGTIYDENGNASTVQKYPVSAGDPVYEGDVLIVTASIKDGAVPDDPDYVYSDVAGQADPFEYVYTYATDSGDLIFSETTEEITYTVTGEINETDAALTLEIVPNTTPKLWRYNIYDTSWYSAGKTEFTLTTARQLAGLAVLVNSGNDFAGKTIKLGCDISLKNDDGSEGERYWDGIGNSEDTPFAGTFDGQGYKITDMLGSKNGLFGYIQGISESSLAVVKNLTLYGSVTGSNASGVAAYAKNAEITDCDVYCDIHSTVGRSGGIVGYAGNQNTVCIISDCVNYGIISTADTMTGDSYLGGIAAQTGSKAEITNCINKGNVISKGEGGNYVGGIVGNLAASIKNCANYGDVTAVGRYVGGVAGASTSKTSRITNCYNVGDVTLKNCTSSYDSVGGIIGYASYYIASNCFNYGTVLKSGGASTSHVGSIFGQEGARSQSSSADVYALDSANTYVEESKKISALPSATYTAGLKVADAKTFAAADGVLAAINDDGVFVLGSAGYPELKIAGDTHVHSGGSASCSTYAVCDICGKEYGKLDSTAHGETMIVNKSDPRWNIDGYSGDIICVDCREVITSGKTIKAESQDIAMTFNVVDGSDVYTYEFSIADFDSLKTTGMAVFEWGGAYDEKMVATEYVTLDTMLDFFGLDIDDVASVTIDANGNISTQTYETLTTCIHYYDENGNDIIEPYSFAIKFTSDTGTAEYVASGANVGGYIRLGYGINEAQKTTGAGGMRCVSPVQAATIVLNDSAEFTPCTHKNTVNVAATEPTCVNAGYTAGVYCKDCMQYLSGHEKIAALGHSIVSGEYKEATCTESGYTAESHCERCGQIMSVYSTIPALGHEFSDDVKVVKPTYTSKGYSVYTCLRCGKQVTGNETNYLSGWKAENGKYYYYADGAMKTGWLKDNGNWYYLKETGERATGWVWAGAWYYMNSDGVMQTGWVKSGNAWYYMTGSGAMATGWVKVGNAWYYMNGSGVMQTGWVKLGSTWYYMNASGVMQTGTQTINGKTYTFNNSGALIG